MNLLIIGGAREDRIARARAIGAAAHPSAHAVALDAAMLPFVRPVRTMLPAHAPRVVFVDDIERAFPNHQTGGTRLVLTQSSYVVQKWIDLLDEGDTMIAAADRTALARDAEEALQARGPWRLFEVVDLDADATRASTGHAKLSATADTEGTEGKSDVPFVPFVSFVINPAATHMVVRAYGHASSTQREALCREATAHAPADAVAWLALAAACRERQDRDGARIALDRAAALAPDWEAVHYEDGKFWLGADDMVRARDAFARAGALMPAFAAAFSNLGATCGELDDPGAALAAFQQALRHDPASFTILNNVGVVSRELGRLDESEAAFRRVIGLAPDFVFGYYNLGHTLFLAGRHADALAAYEAGQQRDPEPNRRQGCRLALMRFATGDLAGAERDLWRFVKAAPADERDDLLLEAYEIAHALVDAHPGLAAQQAFLDRIAAALSGSS